MRRSSCSAVSAFLRCVMSSMTPMKRSGWPAASLISVTVVRLQNLAAALAEIALLERVFRDFSGEQLANRRLGHCTVVRVRELAEGHLVELCLGVPENLAEAPVQVDEMAVERGQGDADSRLVEDVAKLLVTREQRVSASERLEDPAPPLP